MGVVSRKSHNAKKEEVQENKTEDETKQKTHRYSGYEILCILIFLVFVILISMCVIQLVIELRSTDEDADSEEFIIAAVDTPGEDEAVIMWWTPFTGQQGISRLCGEHRCFFTQNRSYEAQAKALMFYGSNFNIADLPLPRKKGALWALLHEESPKNTPVLAHKQMLDFFNFTSTFSRFSHFPLTLQYLESIRRLQDKRFFLPASTRSSLRSTLAPVVYVQSTCDTPIQRDDYVKELMKYIDVDSYGACLHNKDLPKSLRDPVEAMAVESFLKLLGQYKFSIAIENGVCEDYITEKLWRPLTVGSVPLYYGSPSIKDWLPNPKSAILISDFKSPEELATYLHHLDANDTAFEEYLQHKLDPKGINNQRLILGAIKREWGIMNHPEERNFIEMFECYVCQSLSENIDSENSGKPIRYFQSEADHYSCPAPASVLTGKPDLKNWWLEHWQMGFLEAQVLQKFLNINKKFSSDDVHHALVQYINSHQEWRNWGLEGG